MIRVGDLANILGTPEGKIHRKLTKLSFEILENPFQAFIYGHTNFSFHLAVQHRFPLII